jgi:hypothetical protein
MHGMIFVALRQYVGARIGKDKWPALVAETDLADRVFFVAHQFPDGEFRALVAAVAKTMDIPSAAVLEDFGQFIAADLLRGTVRGIATHYGEQVQITETTCMLKGAEQCTIDVRMVAR